MKIKLAAVSLVSLSFPEPLRSAVVALWLLKLFMVNLIEIIAKRKTDAWLVKWVS